MSCALVDGTALPQLQPQDYLLLHQAAAANDLEAVCVRTSRPLAPAEAVEQWYAMLYDPQVSRHAAQEIGQLNATAAAASSTRTPSVGAPVLRGHGVAFSLQTDCSIGRSTADNKVDVDVSAQPDAFKVTPRCSGPSITCVCSQVSRKHLLIKRGADGSLTCHNVGKRLVRVDGDPLLRQQSRVLKPTSDINLCGIRFLLGPADSPK